MKTNKKKNGNRLTRRDKRRTLVTEERPRTSRVLHIHTYTCIYTRMLTCMHRMICMYTYTHVCLSMCMHVHVYIHTRVCIVIPRCVYVCAERPIALERWARHETRTTTRRTAHPHSTRGEEQKHAQAGGADADTRAPRMVGRGVNKSAPCNENETRGQCALTGRSKPNRRSAL